MTPSQVTPGPKRREAAAAEGPPTRSGRKGEAAGSDSFDEMAPVAKRWRFVRPPDRRRNEGENERQKRLVMMKRHPYRSDVEGMLREMSTRCPRIHDEVAGLY